MGKNIKIKRGISLVAALFFLLLLASAVSAGAKETCNEADHGIFCDGQGNSWCLKPNTPNNQKSCIIKTDQLVFLDSQTNYIVKSLKVNTDFKLQFISGEKKIYKYNFKSFRLDIPFIEGKTLAAPKIPGSNADFTILQPGSGSASSNANTGCAATEGRFGGNGVSGGETFKPGQRASAHNTNSDVCAKSLGGFEGVSGGIVQINSGTITIDGELSVSGLNGLAGWNGAGDDNSGCGGAGGGGGGGGGYLFLVSNTSIIDGSGEITANGGNGGVGGDPTDDDGHPCGDGNDAGSGGGHGGGGAAGYVVVSSEVTLSPQVIESGGLGAIAGFGRECDCHIVNARGGDGQEVEEQVFVSSEEGELCNDGKDNDYDGKTDMADTSCNKGSGTFKCLFKADGVTIDTEKLKGMGIQTYNPSATDGTDGCCGDDKQLYSKNTKIGDYGYVSPGGPLGQIMCITKEDSEGNINAEWYEILTTEYEVINIKTKDKSIDLFNKLGELQECAETGQLVDEQFVGINGDYKKALCTKVGADYFVSLCDESTPSAENIGYLHNFGEAVRKLVIGGKSGNEIDLKDQIDERLLISPKDWNHYLTLEIDINFDEMSNTLKIELYEGSTKRGSIPDVLKYSTKLNKTYDGWHHLIIPIKDFGLGSNKVNKIKFTFINTYEGNEFKIANPHLKISDGENYYCSKKKGTVNPNVETYEWVKNLDFSGVLNQNACDGQNSMVATGKQCCGNDPGQIDTYNDVGSPDNPEAFAGCYGGIGIKNNTIIGRTIIDETKDNLLYVKLPGETTGKIYTCGKITSNLEGPKTSPWNSEFIPMVAANTALPCDDINNPDSPGCTTGGGGGTCTSNWQCSNWNTCTNAGTQTRTCTDTNKCDPSNPSNPNPTTQACSPPSSPAGATIVGCCEIITHDEMFTRELGRSYSNTLPPPTDCVRTSNYDDPIWYAGEVSTGSSCEPAPPCSGDLTTATGNCECGGNVYVMPPDSPLDSCDNNGKLVKKGGPSGPTGPTGCCKKSILCNIFDPFCQTTYSYDTTSQSQCIGLNSWDATCDCSSGTCIPATSTTCNSACASDQICESGSCVKKTCILIWICGDWSPDPCTLGTTQTRTCTDICSQSTSAKPAESKTCAPPSPEPLGCCHTQDDVYKTSSEQDCNSVWEEGKIVKEINGQKTKTCITPISCLEDISSSPNDCLCGSTIYLNDDTGYCCQDRYQTDSCSTQPSTPTTETTTTQVNSQTGKQKCLFMASYGFNSFAEDKKYREGYVCTVGGKWAGVFEDSKDLRYAKVRKIIKNDTYTKFYVSNDSIDEKNFECCPDTTCYDATAKECVLQFTLNKNKDKVCIDNEWKPTAGLVKSNWIDKDETDSGFCTEEKQCFCDMITDQSDPSSCSGVTYNKEDLILTATSGDESFVCAKNGTFSTSDGHICMNGKWTTRTALLATQLLDLNVVKSANTYSLSCASTSLALNDGAYTGDTPVCVLSYGSEGTENRIIATYSQEKLNIKNDGLKDFVGTLLNDQGGDQAEYKIYASDFTCPGITNKDEFKKCNDNAYWNNHTQSLIYGYQGLPAIDPAVLSTEFTSLLLDPIKTIMDLLFGGSQQSIINDAKSYKLVTEEFDMLYFAKNENSKIKAFAKKDYDEDGNLIIGYVSVDYIDVPENVCAQLREKFKKDQFSFTCMTKKDGDGNWGQYVTLMKPEEKYGKDWAQNYWQDFTSKVKLGTSTPTPIFVEITYTPKGPSITDSVTFGTIRSSNELDNAKWYYCEGSCSSPTSWREFSGPKTFSSPQTYLIKFTAAYGQENEQKTNIEEIIPFYVKKANS